MPRKSNKATCKLETSLSEFCFMIQGSGVGRKQKKKPLNKPRNRPTNGFSEPSRGLTARPQKIGNLPSHIKVEPDKLPKTRIIFRKVSNSKL